MTVCVHVGKSEGNFVGTSLLVHYVGLELRLSNLLAGTITLLSHLHTAITMTLQKDMILAMDEPSFFFFLSSEDKTSFAFYPLPSSILWNPYSCWSLLLEMQKGSFYQKAVME